MNSLVKPRRRQIKLRRTRTADMQGGTRPRPVRCRPVATLFYINIGQKYFSRDDMVVYINIVLLTSLRENAGAIFIDLHTSHLDLPS